MTPFDFVTVHQAEKIIQAHTRDYGSEEIAYGSALGRVLAEDLYADRDLPPFNRATVDGIAIQYSAWNKAIHSFKIKGTQAAGEMPKGIAAENECIEIMTGSALDETVDTIIRYEDIQIREDFAVIKIQDIKKGQNVHARGKDKKQGDRVAGSGQLISPDLIGLAASIGKTRLLVKKLPHTVIITTGDEMVSSGDTPTPYQLRRSNDSTILAALQHYDLPADTIHLKDDYELIKNELICCLQQYDVLLISGGVSMGKFDYVPLVLEELSVKKLFHKVKQRPGKPFWFGEHANNALVFAFPGNPVSVFLCLHRYFMPWLEASLGMKPRWPEYAILQKNICFPHPLQYFAQVKLAGNDRGQWLAESMEGNGSGDFANLIQTDAFIELPLEQNDFEKGEVHRVWRYHF